MPAYSFPKSSHVRKSTEFREIYDRGRVLRSKYFVLFFLSGHGEKPAGIGITVTRRFGRAHRRNRIKRLIRESFRKMKGAMPSVRIVINVRHAANRLSFREVWDDLENLFQKAGLIPC